MYALNGTSKNNNEENPEISITITWSNFLKSFIIIAKKVSGIANFKPQCSGIIEPKKIPIIVVSCHVVHKVTPAPRR